MHIVTFTPSAEECHPLSRSIRSVERACTLLLFTFMTIILEQLLIVLTGMSSEHLKLNDNMQCQKAQENVDSIMSSQVITKISTSCTISRKRSLSESSHVALSTKKPCEELCLEQ